MYSVRLPAPSTTPGANTDTTTLYSSEGLVKRDADAHYYALTLKNSHGGYLKVYGSSNGGSTWHQFQERYVPAATTRRTNDIAFRVDGHADFKVEWVNGGLAQSTWYVAQVLTDDIVNFEQGADAFNYIVNGNLAADIEGAAVMVGPNREVVMFIQSTATNTPNGTLALQGTLDGTTWKTIPGAASELPAAGNLAAQDRVCVWTDLNFPLVRLFWDAASGGTGATFNAQLRSR